jgi:hypothetical protein
LPCFAAMTLIERTHFLRSFTRVGQRIGRHPPARAFSWALIDQGLSSVTNLAASVAVAKSTSPATFGGYSLAFIGYTVAVGVAVNLGVIPAMIRPREDPEEQRRNLERSVSAGSTIGVMASVPLIAAALISGPARRPFLFLFAAMMPVLVLQALWRASFLAERAPAKAAKLDGIWFVVQGLTSAILLGLDIRGGVWFAGSWGLGAAAGALWVSYRTDTWPHVERLRSHLREYRDLTPNLVGEFAAFSGVIQTMPYALAPIVGLDGIAAIKAGQLELGILNIPLQGILPLSVAYAVRAYSRGADELRKVLRKPALVGGVSIVVVGVAISLLPARLMYHLVGPNASAAKPLVLPLAAALLGMWLCNTAFAGLRARADVRITFILQSAISLTFLAAALLGGAKAGPVGACISMAVANLLGAGLAWAFHLSRMHAAESKKALMAN